MGRQALALLAAAFFVLGSYAHAQGVDMTPPPGTESSGEREMKALAAAWPDRISQVALRDGDWAVDVDGQWYDWAHGRVLPESQRTDWERFARYRFYSYPVGTLPPLTPLDPQAAARLQKSVQDSQTHPPRRSEDFLEHLLGGVTRGQLESRIVTVDFLGHPVKVHQVIASAMRAVAAECDALRRTDPQAAAFLAGLAEVDGFNYRDVAGTLTRSYHGYGLAVDLIPRNYGGKATYWRWLLGKVEQWWATPYASRWMVPESVVSIFEKHGFGWGGKWLFFDTMHFEYRPEIIILAGGQAS